MDWPTRLAAHVMSSTSRNAMLEAALEHVPRVLQAPIRMILPAAAAAADLRAESVYAGMRALHFDQYVQLWRHHDPVLRAALARRGAVCDVDRLPSGAGDAFSVGFVRRLGAEAYLVAPLYDPDGGIAGTLHGWRYTGSRAFDAADAVQAMAFAAVLSVLLARRPEAVTVSCRLAPREHQIALLAARGYSNKDIARQLSLASETVKQTLRRVYRKVSVGSRTELAAHYARTGLL